MKEDQSSLESGGAELVWRTISGDKELLLCRICASINFPLDVSDQWSLRVPHAEH